MDESICRDCTHAVVYIEGGDEVAHCRLVKEDMGDVESCSAYVRSDERLMASTEELGRFLIRNFGSELSREMSVRGAALTVAQSYVRLRREEAMLLDYMEEVNIHPPREKGESLIRWVLRGFQVGKELTEKTEAKEQGLM